MSTGQFTAFCHNRTFERWILNNRDMWIIAMGDAFTSIFAGMVVFSTLGVLSFEVNKDITLVAKQGNVISARFIVDFKLEVRNDT